MDLSTPFHPKFVKCFFRVKSILWGGSLFLVSRIRHIINNVNLFSVSIQLFQSLGSKGTLLENELFFIHLFRLPNDEMKMKV